MTVITYRDMWDDMLNGPDEAWVVKERVTGQILHGHGASRNEIEADRRALEWELKYNLTKGTGWMSDTLRQNAIERNKQDHEKRNGTDQGSGFNWSLG